MPRKSDVIAINNENLDRRVKLKASDKEKIKKLYETGEYSQRNLASMFNISRRTIQFVISPEKLEQNKSLRKEKGGWRVYYNKEYSREAIKKHRQYKKELYLEGKIGIINNEISLN